MHHDCRFVCAALRTSRDARSINEKQVRRDVLAPAFIDYETPVLFQTQDVNRSGARGAQRDRRDRRWRLVHGRARWTMGSMRCEPARVMLQLEVTMSDGTCSSSSSPVTSTRTIALQSRRQSEEAHAYFKNVGGHAIDTYDIFAD
jgi:hypothetical protein